MRGKARILALLCCLVVFCVPAGRVAAAEPSIDSVRVADRVIEVYWERMNAETTVAFGGYKIWRAIGTPELENFVLLQKFSINEPVGWGFAFNTLVRRFIDPDSLFSVVESLYVDPSDPRSEADPPCYPECDSISARVRRSPWDGYQRRATWGPFNGVPYYYSVTYFDAIFDSLTNQMINVDRTSINSGIWRGGLDDTTAVPVPVFCFPAVNQNLGEVTVVPNPYSITAPWDLPGNRKIGFMNLPLKATLRIYTVAGDFVAAVEHDAAVIGLAAFEGAAYWDLHNDAGKEVAPGIYIYHVIDNVTGEEKRGHFVIVK